MTLVGKERLEEEEKSSQMHEASKKIDTKIAVSALSSINNQ